MIQYQLQFQDFQTRQALLDHHQLLTKEGMKALSPRMA